MERPSSGGVSPRPRSGQDTFSPVISSAGVRASISTFAASQLGRLGGALDDEAPPRSTSPVQPARARSSQQHRRTFSSGSSAPSAALTQPTLSAPVAPVAAGCSRPSSSGAQDEATAQIPTHPEGRYLVLNMVSNWGDPHYIGISGIEIYDTKGQKISLRAQNVFAAPVGNLSASVAGGAASAVASLAGPLGATLVPASSSRSKKSPYDPGNIVREPHASTDELRMWRTPYCPGQPHTAVVVLPQTVQFACVRIWNYNGGGRSRCCRGVRLLELRLDDREIFRGEVRQSEGDARNEAGVETILFTEDERELLLVAQAIAASEAAAEPSGALLGPSGSMVECGAKNVRSSFSLESKRKKKASAGLSSSSGSSGGGAPVYGGGQTMTVQKVVIQLLSSWGEGGIVGLSGLRFIDAAGAVVPAAKHFRLSVRVRDESGDTESAAPAANVREFEDATAGEVGATTPEVLLDDDVNTAWLARLRPGLELVARFRRPTELSAVEVSNLALAGKTFFGVKFARFIADGVVLSTAENDGIVCFRKAPSGAQLPVLLYQSFSAENLSTNSLSASVMTRATMAIKRTSVANQSWPSWLTNPPMVPFLPVGYVVAIVIRPVFVEAPVVNESTALTQQQQQQHADPSYFTQVTADGGVSESLILGAESMAALRGHRGGPASAGKQRGGVVAAARQLQHKHSEVAGACKVTVHDVRLYDELGRALVPDVFCVVASETHGPSPPASATAAAGAGGGALPASVSLDASDALNMTVYAAFDTIACLSGISITSKGNAEVSVLLDDVVVFTATWLGSDNGAPAEGVDATVRTIPFTPESAVLERWKPSLVSDD